MEMSSIFQGAHVKKLSKIGPWQVEIEMDSYNKLLRLNVQTLKMWLQH